MPAATDRRFACAEGVLLSLLLLLLVSTGSSDAFGQASGVAPDEVGAELRSASRAARLRVDAYADAHPLPELRTSAGDKRVQIVDVRAARPIYYASPVGGEIDSAMDPLGGFHPSYGKPPSFTGRGMKVAIWDAGGVLSDHSEFGGRVMRRDAGAPDDHATHIAGTIAGAGLRSEARGVAQDVAVLSFDWADDAQELYEEGIDGLLVSTHAYSLVAGWHFADLEGNGPLWYWHGDLAISAQTDHRFGAYGKESYQLDRVTRSLPFLLPVVAAGNDRSHVGPADGAYRILDSRGRWQPGPRDVRPPRDGGDDGFNSIAGAAVAKNVLTIGSHKTDASGARVTSAFSGMGPTNDARIKPDILAPGEHVISAVARGRSEYASKSGTSMATARASGALILLQQQHIALTGRPMHAATLKGLVIHTAGEVGLPGPDYASGWGALDTEAAMAHLSQRYERPFSLYEGVLHPDEAFIQELVVDQPGPLRVTLAWTDVAGSASRDDLADATHSLHAHTPQLLIDLDLRLEHVASGSVFYPFILDPARPTNVAGTGDNRVDPVEQVRIAEAAPGRYRLHISHKPALTERQAFSVLVTGATDPARTILVEHVNAHAESGEVTVRWNTRAERSTGSFRIERTYVDDAAGWNETAMATSVGSVEAIGSAAAGRAYILRDQPERAGSYEYRLIVETPDGAYEAGRRLVELPRRGARVALSAYPNPFSRSSTIDLTVTAAMEARVELFDVSGRLVSVLSAQHFEAGRHPIRLDAQNWSAGSYFVRVTTPEETSTLPVIVVR